MLIAGYYIKQEIDRGDAWLNAVDPQYVESTMHKECAWNYEALRDIHNNADVVEFDKITYEQATTQGLVCGYCEKPLTEKQYFAFQVENLAGCPLCGCDYPANEGGFNPYHELWVCPACIEERIKEE